MGDIECKYFRKLIKDIEPEIVLESGTWKGTGSTLAIVKALIKNKKGVLYTYEIHKDFYDLAVKLFSSAKYKNYIVLKNENILDGIRTLDDNFYSKLSFIFLDGGDELINGFPLLPMDMYIEHPDLSENVLSFKMLEKKINPGTHVLLHDWEIGRGSFVKSYLKSINYDGWILEHEIEKTETGMAHLIKK